MIVRDGVYACVAYTWFACGGCIIGAFVLYFVAQYAGSHSDIMLNIAFYVGMLGGCGNVLIFPVFQWFEPAAAVAKYEAFLESERRIAAASDSGKRAAAAARYPALFGANPTIMDIATIFRDRDWLSSRDFVSAHDRNVRDAIEARLRELKLTESPSFAMTPGEPYPTP